MRISQLDPTQADRFGSQHSLHHPLPDGQTLLMLSGIVHLDYRCPGWSNENTVTGWYEETLSLTIALPPGFLAAGEVFRIEQAVPFLSLNGIDGTTNVGWSVKRFAISTGQSIEDSVQLEVDLAVTRSGENLRQVGYQISLLGRISSNH